MAQKLGSAPRKNKLKFVAFLLVLLLVIVIESHRAANPRPPVFEEANARHPSPALQGSGMSWMNEIANVLQSYSQGGQPGDEGDVDAHFHQVAQTAPPADLASGIAAMFHSDQTPPFAQMVGQLFSNSNGAQRASLLNTLLSSGAAAGTLSQLSQTAGVSLPTGLGSTGAITPEAAAQITPEMAQQAAAQAQAHDPSIIDRVSEIYAQHPTLVKTLGAAAMTIALSHLANRQR